MNGLSGITFPATGGSKTFQYGIDCDMQHSISFTTNVNWLQYSVTNEEYVTITARPNTTSQQRNGSFSVKLDGKVCEDIPIIQDAS